MASQSTLKIRHDRPMKRAARQCPKAGKRCKKLCGAAALPRGALRNGWLRVFARSQGVWAVATMV